MPAQRQNVILPIAVRQAIRAHALRDRPRECCGLLIGRRRAIVTSIPMRNVARGVTRYRIDDREHIALRRTLRFFEPPLEIVGVYHSHPDGPPAPSASDIADSFYPEWAYVVVGLGGEAPQLRAYQIGQGRAVPLRLLSSGR